ncbi:MAG: DUF2339 domain-containing protein [Bacteroidales bacterium]|nr:DUF2339 domain-containing protein [Bacteroidales bacterium]
MNSTNDRINRLVDRLEILLKRQEEFSAEINALRLEIINLKKDATSNPPSEAEGAMAISSIASDSENDLQASVQPQAEVVNQPVNTPPKQPRNLERFIGESLISKIGIAITVIGLAIGTKYSIEHDLISPLTRIVLGYLAGLGLLGVGIKLKEKYENYSAVLVSGAMATLYFVTYGAYSFYSLIPQALTFALMVVFTAFTVVAALTYNKQVIAHIGLVGAYAVPFLLSDGSGRVGVMFTYMTIVNLGILAITFQRYWKSLFYSSFGLTWLIFFVWFASKYQVDIHFDLALTFLSVFFILFYLIFIAYKLVKGEKVQVHDVLLLLANSFVFYGIGYAILNSHSDGAQFLGLFTLGSALIHFAVSVAVYLRKLADRSLFYLVSALVLTFITIAIPVQLNGNWVTLLWVAEAALLFWLGRTRSIAVYEKFSYPLMLLACFSIFHDWIAVYAQSGIAVTPIFNVHFLTSMLFVSGFGFIGYLNSNRKYPSALASSGVLPRIMTVSVIAIGLIVLYNAFRFEIAEYWNQRFDNSLISVNVPDSECPESHWNHELRYFKTIWLVNYSLLFAAVLSVVGIFRGKNQNFGLFCLILNAVMVAVFLFAGLYAVSELRATYLEQTLAEYYHRGVFYLGIRYVSLVFVAIPLALSYVLSQRVLAKGRMTLFVDFMLTVSVLWILSSELINWLDVVGSRGSYKLGLSVLWGVYALLLVVLGLWRKKKHLRIAAIVLFGITLIKLFLYDISHLNTIAKTAVFVLLGVLMLVISFLYNKYKHIITDGSES